MRLALAVLLTLGAGWSQAQELIVNGSFEEPPVAALPTYDYLPGNLYGVTGWQTVMTGVERFDPNIYGVGAARQGQLAVDLNTDYGIGGGIFQTIDTVPGQGYLLSFHAGTWRAAGRDGYARITVSAGNRSELFTIANERPTLEWQRRRMLFHATSTRTTVAFVNFSNPSENFSLLDDVSVVPLP